MAGFWDPSGDIRREFLPFVLDAAKKDQPQIFTFARNNNAITPANTKRRLQICPQQFLMEQFMGNNDKSMGKDLSFRLLFGADQQQTLDFDQLLNNLPTVQVREFQQDSRLGEIFNLFREFQNGMAAYNENKNKRSQGDLTCIGNKFKKALEDAVSGSLDDVVKWSDEIIKGIYEKKENEYAYVMSVPYILYTQLIATTTNNLYVLPYNGKLIFNTDGNYGYGAQRGISGAGVGNANSILGKALNFVGATVKVNMTPRFTPTDGGEAMTIQVDLDLFNDSLDGAITNFIFVNTLFPGNMWTQYHIQQQAPSLYDIKVEGFQRLFVCSGKFNCEYKGVMRFPGQSFYDELKKHVNTGSKYATIKDDIDTMRNNALVKIPDVYSLRLTFKSLLPDNLNNYLFQFSQNSHINTYPVRDGFGAGDMFSKWCESIKTKVFGEVDK